MKPVLQALVLAERVYEDKTTGKKIIAGTFNQLLIQKGISPPEQRLPDGSKRWLVPGGTDSGCPAAYISLTGVAEGTELSLQFVNVSKNEVLFQTGFRITSVNRLDTIEIVAPLPPMAMFVQETGTFSLDVVWNNEILGSHRILIKEIDSPN